MAQDFDVKQGMVLVKTWSNQNIMDDKNIKEILALDNTSLWWFLEHSLLKRITGSSDEEESKPSRLTPALLKFYRSCKYLARGFYGRRMLHERADKRKAKAKILLITQSRNWGITYESKEIKRADRQFNEIINALKREGYDVLAVEESVMPLLNIKTLREKRRLQRGLWVPMEAYCNLITLFEANRQSRQYNRLWRRLKHSQEFEKTLKDHGSPLHDHVGEELGGFLTKGIFDTVVHMEMAKTLINREDPDLILISCEYCLHGRSTVIACKMRGIPSLALQHGIINQYHLGYFHIPDEISKDGELTATFCPLPEKTLVYGPYVQDELMKECNYPEGSVVVTGQPRYDVLAEPEKHFNKVEFCTKHSLDISKKLILLATQPFPEKRREAFLRPTLRALNKLPNTQILIKPHPAEDALWIKKTVENEGADALILSKTLSIYEVLYSCDIMLTVSSTTAIEAMILEKPVVIVNIIAEKASEPYVQSGAALGVTQEKDLLPAIKQALYDENTQTRLKEARERFVYEHAYKTDGRSTQRVVELIEEMIKKTDR